MEGGQKVMRVERREWRNMLGLGSQTQAGTQEGIHPEKEFRIMIP